MSSAPEVIRVLRPKTGEEGGCSAPPPFDPVSIPHDIEWRGVTTGSDREPNRQVDDPLRPAMQVTEPAGLNLSRWRHGFEPRWDYKQKAWSEAHSGFDWEAMSPLVPHLSRRRCERVTCGLGAQPTVISARDAAPRKAVRHPCTLRASRSSDGRAVRRVGGTDAGSGGVEVAHRFAVSRRPSIGGCVPARKARVRLPGPSLDAPADFGPSFTPCGRTPPGRGRSLTSPRWHTPWSVPAPRLTQRSAARNE